MVDFTTNFTEEIKGKLFAREQTAALEENGYVISLSGNRVTQLSSANDSLATFDGLGAASFVGENQEKPANTASWAKQPISVGKVVSQVRVSSEVLRYSTESNLSVLADVYRGSAVSAARAIDILVTHGTDPATGNAVVGGNGVSIYSWLTQNAQNEVADGSDPQSVNAAIERALGEVSGANGIVLSKNTRSNLAGWRNDFGLRQLEELAFAGSATSLHGLPTIVTNAITNTADIASGASGEDTGVLAIVGDWSKVRFGITDSEYETLEHGSPDGGPDLKRVNQVILRKEDFVKYAIEHPEAFVVINDSNGGGEGN